MRKRGRAGWLGALCMVSLALAPVPPAQAVEAPLFVFVPKPHPSLPPLPPSPPPNSYFNGPCGLAVDSQGRFYVSDYHHNAVDVFVPPPSPYTTPPFYVAQRTNVDPLDGPCALALDASNNLYVNVYHRSVAKFSPAPSFTPGPVFGADEPTGVAVAGSVFVNHRTYIGVYDASGVPVLDGSEPLKIGLGSLGDGYGLAASSFPGTSGWIYAPDASDNTVKVYDPAVDTVNPVQIIDHPEGFVSLRDSAVAVDRVSGDVYVIDNTQPAYTEEPEATVYVFDSTGAYLGHLKYNIVHGGPAGLAVDNSATVTQGRVYVTSGNTHEAGLYAYSPGAATKALPKPPSAPLTLRLGGTGGGEVISTVAGIECASACSEQVRAGSEISLNANPDQGSTFLGWSGGGCSGTGTCMLQMSAATSVSAEFTRLPSSPPPATGSPSVVTGRSSYQAMRPRRGRQPRRARTRRHAGQHRHHRGQRGH